MVLLVVYGSEAYPWQEDTSSWLEKLKYILDED